MELKKSGMKAFLFHGFMVLAMILPSTAYTQEKDKIEVEESAEVFLDDYTDEFQETFFEALKQKGIQNYDRASNLLLKCKQLRPDDAAIDHELAKVNLLDKNYIVAEQYAIEALLSESENYWFLNTLSEVLQEQGNNFESIKTRIPYENEKLRHNLSAIHFKQKRYDAALTALEGLNRTDFVISMTKRILDSLNQTKNTSENNIVKKEAATDNPILALQQELQQLISISDFEALKQASNEAIEAYPLQPYFYYLNGLALNRTQEFKAATEVLETGLDYLFDKPELAKKFYTELGMAYQGLGNPSKANEYLSRAKSGL